MGWGFLVAMAVAMSTIPHTVDDRAAPPSGAQGAVAPVALPSSGEIAPTGGEYTGLPVGAWTLFPSLFVGAVWDSNNNQASSNQGTQRATGSAPDSGTSLEVSPRIV